MFFRDAKDALTSKPVIETSANFAAAPDNGGRENAATNAILALIDKAKADMRRIFKAPGGQFFGCECGA